MASSDEEGELFPENVTNYHFVNSRKEPISFSILPLLWSDEEFEEVIGNEESLVVYLLGNSDGGLQSVYKQAIGWKLDFSYAVPEVYVFCKGKRWIQLQKPRKSYEEIVKRALILAHCLHFAKRNLLATRKEFLSHMREKLRSYDLIESLQNCLSAHLPLIKSAMAKDMDLAKSKCLEDFLIEIENPGRKPIHEEIQTSISKFIVYDDDESQNDNDSEEEPEGLFDSVCAFCDNGGVVLSCEGQCMRSFHPTVDTGIDTSCESLGFANAAEYEAVPTFICGNCKHQRHQCFVCGLLGSSDKSSSAEVFLCVSATCGHFYHPDCVANLLYPSDETLAGQHKSQIAAGKPFTCPIHKCCKCQQGENKDDPELQFAVCARCPKAYHRKCLPKRIVFSDSADGTILQRAWDDLLPNRILMYCMEHRIIPGVATPRRDHLLFPSIVWKRNQDGSRTKMMSERRSKAYGTFRVTDTERMPKVIERRVNTVTHDGTSSEKCKSSTMCKRTSSFGNVRVTDTERMPKVVESRVNTVTHDGTSLEKCKSSVMYKRASFSVNLTGKRRANTVTHDLKKCKSSIMYKKTSSFEDSKSTPRNLEQASNIIRIKSPNKDTSREQQDNSESVKRTEATTPLKVDAEMKTKILKMMKDSTSSFDFDEYIKEKKAKCTHKIYSPQHGLDKAITMGKVEAYVKAVKAALKVLEDGGSVEDAKDVCEPDVLHKLNTWKKKLQVYLAPFLIGPRYTSFGRHFTKVDKLKEIVSRLHWYVEHGDTIVDFCCGSNDFSWLMKEELDSTGKKCNFKNYDLIPPKNSFNFEKRDWFSVPVEELPDGSGLVMGLNPPFGVRASLANKFIHHALKFKPKLIILIVPEETRRLDSLRSPYDLIWEEHDMCSGKSFYLPGSVDIKDQPLDDWNVRPPPLSLWSRPDWTAKHLAIARKQSHIRPTPPQEAQQVVSDYLMEDNLECVDEFCNIMSNYPDITAMLDDVPEEPNDATQPNALDVVADMDLSSPAVSPIHPRSEPMGHHPGLGPYANHGYAGGSTSSYGQPELTGEEYIWPPGTTPPDQRYN